MELIPSHCFGIGKIIHKRTRDTDNFFQYNAPYLSINLSNTINIHPFISLNRFNLFSIFYNSTDLEIKKRVYMILQKMLLKNTILFLIVFNLYVSHQLLVILLTLLAFIYILIVKIKLSRSYMK